MEDNNTGPTSVGRQETSGNSTLGFPRREGKEGGEEIATASLATESPLKDSRLVPKASFFAPPTVRSRVEVVVLVAAAAAVHCDRERRGDPQPLFSNVCQAPHTIYAPHTVVGSSL